jgi:hypothetical protein
LKQTSFPFGFWLAARRVRRDAAAAGVNFLDKIFDGRKILFKSRLRINKSPEIFNENHTRRRHCSP